MRTTPLLMLLGSGELGREVVISAKRLGCSVIAVDSYAGAPAMQVADGFEVLNMLDGDALEAVIRKHAPDFVVPEIEAIRTERLVKLEAQGQSVVPSARAAHLTMNRDAIRDLASRELKLPTARFAYAESAEELRRIVLEGRSPVGLPCVIKPVMSSSGKGQSVAKKPADLVKSWDYACEGMRGDTRRVIAEEFIDFDYEITVLTIRQRAVVGGKKLAEKDRTLFVRPIGHRQERGDYQESWAPCAMKPALVRKAQAMARAITSEIAGKHGAGLFGVEFFVKGDRVIFSELSPRPHDTGMVTMIGQDLSEFDLHVRAILGLPIPAIHYGTGKHAAAASAVILAHEASSEPPSYEGVEKALALPTVQVRLFGKPSTRKYRRMGVVLATAATATAARKLAKKAAAMVKVKTGRK
ncbi:MAG: formate-dependent phosphoribosylglycinamide formyltransferase [Tepidisphaera sp.]